MYDIIQSMIDHAYVSNYSGDQQYIYYICGAIIIIFVCVIIDLIYRIFSHFWR